MSKSPHPRGGVPPMQKLRAPLVGALGYQRLILSKPVVGPNIGLHAVPAHRASPYLFSDIPAHLTSLPQFFFNPQVFEHCCH